MDDENPTKEKGIEPSDSKPKNSAKPSDTKPKNSDFRIAMISGSCAIFGVLMGALITGYFSTKSQSIIAQQQTAALSRQIVQGERQELKKALSDYAEVITDYYQLVSNEKLSSKEIDRFAKKAYVAAFYITIVISMDLGQKTFEMNQVFFENLQAKTANKYSKNLEAKVITKFTEWILIAKGELKLLEYTVSPENLSTDLLRLLLRGGLSTKDGKK